MSLLDWCRCFGLSSDGVVLQSPLDMIIIGGILSHVKLHYFIFMGDGAERLGGGLLRILHSLFIRMPSCLPILNVLKFSDFEPRIILKLFLNTKAVTLRNIFKLLLMFYYVIKVGKSLYFVSIMQKYI